MNAISEITSWLTTQNVVKKYDGLETKTVSETEEPTDPNSFLSILNLLDVNANGKTETEELKFGAGFMINSFLYSNDQNNDLLLSAEELGVSPSLISLLDTNSDQQLSNGEVITPANKIIDGLVSILDTNGDSALSRDELAIFELLSSAFSSISNNQEADTETIFDLNRSSTGEKLELDMDKIPDRMRQAGFQGSDNALYYALAHVYRYGPDMQMPDDEAGSLAVLNTQREAIYNWFDNEITKVEDILEKNPQTTVTAITNDGRDKCGFRLGAAIMEHLKDFGDRVQMGPILPESEYEAKEKIESA